MDAITSLANPLLKDIRRSLTRGSLTSNGCMVAETFHLLDEALRSDCAIERVIAAESAEAAVRSRLRGRGSIRVSIAPDALFAKISSTETSQGVLALVHPRAWSRDDLFRYPALVAILDGVQDPGNAGTIVRAAEAFGATGVMFLRGAASPYNAKTLRASAGSLFRIPYGWGLAAETALAELRGRGVEAYAAVVSGGKPPAEMDLARPCALVIGSESRGVSPAFRPSACGLRIPTVAVESLNAAMAASILLYEASRQRRDAA